VPASGLQNPKFITTIYDTNQQPLGCWTYLGYNFNGI